MNQKTKHKLFMHTLLVLTSVTLFVGIMSSPMVYAAEKTGRIISEIINDVGNEMDKLETFVEKNKSDTDSLNKTLDSRYEAFRKADSAMELEKIKADVLLYSARLNACDIKEIRTYMTTISTLIPMMSKLDHEYKKLSNHGFESGEALGRYKGHVGNQLVNASQMVQQMKKLSGKNALKGLPAIEQAIVSLSNMFSDKGTKQIEGMQPFRERIANLENTYAMLETTRNQLEKEKFLLKHDNLNQLARLGMLRLTKGKMNVNNIQAIPGYMQKSIAKRQQRYMEVMHTHKGDSSAEDYYAQSHENDEILARIASGNPFDK